MLEINYDAGRARSTWKDVETLALHLHHPAEAARAEGEQGIAAFILGDTDTAKKLVLRAWVLSKVENDPAATVRYASIFGAGLVQLHRYKEALTPLNDAIKLAASEAGRCISHDSRLLKDRSCLTGSGNATKAYQLANEVACALARGTRYEGHKSQSLHHDRGSVNRDRGNWGAAISDYQHAVEISSKIDNFRHGGMTDAGGLLAAAYVHTGDLRAALAAINTAIDANPQTPDELYLVPRNVAIKADITARLRRYASLKRAL